MIWLGQSSKTGIYDQIHRIIKDPWSPDQICRPKQETSYMTKTKSTTSVLGLQIKSDEKLLKGPRKSGLSESLLTAFKTSSDTSTHWKNSTP
ncbi:hypothetical protein AUO95_03845 [Corynebacterium glutamicum]|nr:hypothetical protein AUO95_03845 [Corynebacterium glutamicum]